MTAFYMFRLYFGIFWGTENKEAHAHHTPHEAPLSMTVPLIILSLITVGVGVYTTLAGFLGCIGFFLLVLVFGLAYAWRKGALEWK